MNDIADLKGQSSFHDIMQAFGDVWGGRSKRIQICVTSHVDDL